MRILAIDPGNERSGWALYDSDDHAVIDSGNEEPNERLEAWVTAMQTVDCQDPAGTFDQLVIEDVVSYGKAVGASTFETCKWIGYFARAWRGDDPAGRRTHLVTRTAVKLNLCGGSTYIHPLSATPKKVGPAEVRRALLERFPGTGGGKTPEIGTKKQPGPLFGLSGEHAWSALAVAITHVDLQRQAEAAS